MTPRTHSDSVVVARPPHELYDMIADVTRMGEYSPICAACWWDDGDGPRLGAHFTGRNVLPERTWETRSEVVTADPGREFAWVVGPRIARWGYTFTAVDGGTEVTYDADLRLKGARRILDPVFGIAFRRLCERARARMEEVLAR